ncbi:hypothetical protein [Nitrosopumilus sp. S4]
MAKKLNPLLVEKYDISNKIFNELANLESRHILFSIIDKVKTVEDISRELKIPISSVYKKIHSLNDCSLILEKSDFSKKGHIVIWYQSKIKDVKINLTKYEPIISFTKNRKVNDG